MVDINNDSVIKLLQKKEQIVREILRLTQAKAFTGRPDLLDNESAGYVSLYSKREPLIAEVTRIDAQIDYEAIRNSTDPDIVDIALPLVKSTGEMAERILELDKKNSETVKMLFNNTRANIRRIKESRSANERYRVDINAESGSIYDKKSL